MADNKINPLFNIHEKYREVIIINPYRFGKIPIIGETYGGGIVAYILQSTDPDYEVGKTKGLIWGAVISNFSTRHKFSSSNQSTGATGTAIGTGSSNTDAIIAVHGSNCSAYISRAYNGGGYTDWYAPSKNEMNKICLFYNLTGKEPWTSSEINFSNVWLWASGNIYNYPKNFSNGWAVAIRSFTIG